MIATPPAEAGLDVDLLMTSRFGRSEGGRETWAYQFIPRLLAAHPMLRLRVIGMREPGAPDHSKDLLQEIAPADRDRVSFVFLAIGGSRLPVTLQMFRSLRAHMRSTGKPAGQVCLCVGTAELGMALSTSAFDASKKIVWLRTILPDQMASDFPSFLLAPLRRFEAALVRRAQRVIANGEDTADYYRRRGASVTVIENGVALDSWRIAPARLSTPVRIAFVGRLAEAKGIGPFLAAVREISAAPDSRDFEFHVAGDGPYASEVEEAAGAGRLVFHGPVPNSRVPELLDGVDACVALTFKSADGGGAGVSNALLEQMAAGRAIVAWDNVIYRQVVDTNCAWLVPQGDSEKLAQVFRQIRAEPEDVKERIKQGLERVQAYSFDAHMAKFDRVFEETLAQRAPR